MLITIKRRNIQKDLNKIIFIALTKKYASTQNWLPSVVHYLETERSITGKYYATLLDKIAIAENALKLKEKGAVF